MNINQEVKVKFTEHGWIIYNAYYNRFGLTPIEVVKTDGYCYMQMWKVMNIFGPHLGNGLRMPIDPEIEVINEKP